MSKEAYYFSHDSNARQDPKICAMRARYGAEGYGWYWMLIEMLREQEDFKLTCKTYIYDALAMQMQCKKDAIEIWIKDCITEFDLLESDGEFFWSNSLIKRMGSKNEVSEKRRQAANKRWSDANAMQNNANAMQTDAIKGKESKVKYINTINSISGQPEKEPEKSKRFTPPTQQEVYLKFSEKTDWPQRQNELAALKFFNFYESKDWMVGKSKMKNWAAAVNTWVASEKPSGQPVANPKIFQENRTFTKL